MSDKKVNWVAITWAKKSNTFLLGRNNCCTEEIIVVRKEYLLCGRNNLCLKRN